MVRARQPAEPTHIGALFRKADLGLALRSLARCRYVRAEGGVRPGQLLDTLSSDAFRWKAMHNFVDAVADTLSGGFFIWYFKYAATLSADDGGGGSRSLTDAEVGTFVGAIPLLGAVAQVSGTSLLARKWNSARARQSERERRRERGVGSGAESDGDGGSWLLDPRRACVCGYALCAALGVCCFASTTSIFGFGVYYFLYRFCISPVVLWATVSFGWVVDEDSHAHARRGVSCRREGLFTSVLGFTGNLSGVVGNLLVGCVGWAGIDTTGKTPTEEQPASGVLFIRAIYMVAIPALQLLAAYIVWRFPIHSARLERLRENQAHVFKAVSAPASGAQAAQAQQVRAQQVLQQRQQRQHAPKQSTHDASALPVGRQHDAGAGGVDKVGAAQSRQLELERRDQVQAAVGHVVLPAGGVLPLPAGGGGGSGFGGGGEGGAGGAPVGASKWAVAVRSHVI
eukprot:g2336.t1